MEPPPEPNGASEEEEAAALPSASAKDPAEEVAAAASSSGGRVEEEQEGKEQGEEDHEEEDEEEDAATDAVTFTGLVVLPPRQHHHSAVVGGGGERGSKAGNQPQQPHRQALALPAVRSDEPTAAIRAALSEVVGFAHLTNYHLVVENDAAAGGDVAVAEGEKSESPQWNPWTPALISPFTGPGAVVTVPPLVQKLDGGSADRGSTTPVVASLASRGILDEFGDVGPLVERGVLGDGSAIRVVLQRYDLASVKEHVARVRTLLNGNAPSLTSLADDAESEEIDDAVDGEEAGNGGIVDVDEEDPTNKSTSSDTNTGGTDNRAKGTKGGAPNNCNKDSRPPNPQQAPPQQLAPSKRPLPDLPVFTSAPSASRLQDFFYLASGEDPSAYLEKPSSLSDAQAGAATPKGKKKKPKNGGSGGGAGGVISSDDNGAVPVPFEQQLREKLPRLNELEEVTHVDCLVQWSPFHPPPPNRRLMGDLGYLMMTMDGCPTVHVTATLTGFYVNQSVSPVVVEATGGGGQSRRPAHFDPSPAVESCFSHALLDCLLQASGKLRDRWSAALEASKERMRLNHELGRAAPNLSLFRFAVRGDFSGFSSPDSAATSLMGVDATFSTPSWLVPHPRHSSYAAAQADRDGASTSWNNNHLHGWNPIRAEEDLTHHTGIDPRTGGVRDWNEELQAGREFPTGTRHQRVEKARVLYKVMSEFAEAVLVGVKAITEGQVLAMNPMETVRAQVYLHNNIFFSRAVDAGPETFKLIKGDGAARKAANRELQCDGIVHRMDKPGFCTLATALVDYLGTRFVCQGMLPGIFMGDHASKILLGSVESGISLKWDKELHCLLEESIAKDMMIATRPVLRNPLTQERLDEIERLKKEMPPALPEPPKQPVSQEDVDPKAVMMTCMGIDSKGILGGDGRRYVLDFGRLTPRDANWISAQKGGTGKWEAIRRENGKSTAIPSTLDDNEWASCVLRPELVTRFTQYRMAKYVQESRERKKDVTKDGKEERIFETKEGKEFLSTLRLNVNALLPDVRSFDGVDDELAKQLREDEQHLRDAATFLWDEILPKVTKAVRDGHAVQLPFEGRSLVEYLHRHGINCRYLGRLAVLAQLEEEKDAKIDDDLKHGRPAYLVDGRHTMPKCWLELLEIEIVARAAKHVLDSYLLENGGAAAAQPAQLVASFLSALISESEETAAQTETRLEKGAASDPDEDDLAALTITGTGGDGDSLPPPIRSRHEVWQDIELEVGRRFRYTLTLFNTGHNKSGRARHIPLLRRVCQRTGVRLLSKNYDVGGRCLCATGSTHGGKLTASYPISPLDVYDIVPLMKHMAAYNEGFHPCNLWPALTIPPPQVSLRDARLAMEQAQAYTNERALKRGLEFANEALNLCTRVTENQCHPMAIDCIDLMAAIFHEAEDYAMAAMHAEKGLSLTIQSGGFDMTSVVTAHLTLYTISLKLREPDRAVKHLLAALYLIDVMAGPLHIEAHTSYHKLGNIYMDKEYGGKYMSSAVRCFEEASKRDGYDRLMEGITSMHVARALAGMDAYKDAVAAQKEAVRVLSTFLGREHDWTKECVEELQALAKLAVQKGTKHVESEKLAEEAAKADAAAAELLASSVEEKMKHKSKSKKKKGKR